MGRIVDIFVICGIAVFLWYNPIVKSAFKEVKERRPDDSAKRADYLINGGLSRSEDKLWYSRPR
jgi:hypothetical protein